MPQFLVKPLPEVTISHADSVEMPLLRFHLIAIVEPDPETWMPDINDSEQLAELLDLTGNLVEAELWPEEEAEIEGEVLYPKVLWVGAGHEDTYFDWVWDEPLTRVCFLNDYEEYDDLRAYIRGLAAEHPDWRVAVFGAMFEDDVMRVANIIQSLGLSTTVLARYCISSAVFINLDELAEKISRLQQARADLGLDPTGKNDPDLLEDDGLGSGW